MPQDGPANQDCERAAGKRWLTKHADEGLHIVDEGQSRRRYIHRPSLTPVG